MGLFRQCKNNSKPLIRQILDFVPSCMLESCSKQYKADKGCSIYKTYDQFFSMTFGQLKED